MKKAELLTLEKRTELSCVLKKVVDSIQTAFQGPNVYLTTNAEFKFFMEHFPIVQNYPTRLHKNGEMRMHSIEEFDRYAKHLKRIKNRQKLYNKRKRQGKLKNRR